MEVSFSTEDLVTMKRAELQKLCKTVGIKANSKTTQLIEELKKYMNAKKQDEERPASAVDTPAEEVIWSPQHMEEKETDSYQQEILEQLENKVKETMPKSCKIPRFVAQGVIIPATTTPGSDLKKGSKDWRKIHEAQFAKMDSIDVYLAKKRKRKEDMGNAVKRAQESKRTSNTRKSTRKSDVTVLSKSATFVFEDKTGRGVNVPVNDPIKSRLKSPKVFKPLTVSFNIANGESRPKTPNIPRKSMATTPHRNNRFSLGAITNTHATTPTPRKKFDLQASLAKPLPYKPYTGKLQSMFQGGKEQSKIPIRRSKVVSHKTDLKTVKVSTRDQRRDKVTRSRMDKRSEAMSKRRGLAH